MGHVPKDSLKAFTRKQGGEGAQKQVKQHYALPQNWQDFLEIHTTKKSFFKFPADASVSVLGNHVDVVSRIICSSGAATHLTHCSHEEADTGLIRYFMLQIL